ncbi:MAG: hypothetical protein HRS50_02510, partial [Mycoplasmataceae bacterium]|nr:hypothetical protein [Mycoplasmataceae bacterium]
MKNKIQNYRSNKNINLEELDLTKKVHYIFGKNGSGKTKMSREITSLKDMQSLVFNVDYIANNIYEEKLNENGKKELILSNTRKDKTYKIFLSSDLK